MGHCVGSCKSQENTIKVSSPVIKKNIELDFQQIEQENRQEYIDNQQYSQSRHIEKSFSLKLPEKKAISSKALLTFKNLQQYEKEKRQIEIPFENDQESFDEFVDEGYQNNKMKKKKYQDGSVYVGEMIADIKTGKGRLKWEDGSFYIGDFVNDLMHGKGKLITNDGKQYAGEWKNNIMHGKGVMIWPDGRKYEGDYVKGKKDGYGTYTSRKDGKKYIGEWKNGKQHGIGKLIDQNYTQLGQWENGNLLQIYENKVKSDVSIGYDQLLQKTSIERDRKKNGAQQIQ